MMKLPVFFENSKVPNHISKVSPVEIDAISIGLVVFSAGEINEITRRHETIHYRQWVELGFIGFAVLYPLFYLINRIKGMSGPQAYREIPFEVEAYSNDSDPNYLEFRKPYSWVGL